MASCRDGARLRCVQTIHQERERADVRDRRAVLQVTGAGAAPRRASVGDARADGRARSRQRRCCGVPRSRARGLEQADPVLARSRGGLGRARPGRCICARRARGRPRRRRRRRGGSRRPSRASGPAGDERRARDRDLQGGRPPARVRRGVRSRRLRGNARSRSHAHGHREPRHDRGLAPVLDRPGPLSRAQRVALEPQPPARAAPARGDRVPDRERHRGRGRLPDVAAARRSLARAGARGLPR